MIMNLNIENLKKQREKLILEIERMECGEIIRGIEDINRVITMKQSSLRLINDLIREANNKKSG